MIGARVRLTTNYTSQNDNDFIEFDDVLTDSEGFWDVGDPERLTLPTGFDGWWTQVRITAIWDGTGTGGYRELKIFKNGDTTSPWGVMQLPPNAYNDGLQCTTDWLDGLTAGDYFTFALKSASDQTVLAEDNYSIYASIVMARPG